jgi:hypothetical protein
MGGKARPSTSYETPVREGKYVIAVVLVWNGTFPDSALEDMPDTTIKRKGSQAVKKAEDSRTEYILRVKGSADRFITAFNKLSDQLIGDNETGS